METASGTEASVSVDASPAPDVGRIVHYRLDAQDVAAIKSRRNDARVGLFRRESGEGTTQVTRIPLRRGNEPHEGAVYPALIVGVWSDICVNLQVFLDGDDSYWATSRMRADTVPSMPGRWSWPPRAE